VSIDYDGPVPVYRQVAAWIRDRIDDGRYAVDRPIPSKQRIRDELGVSQATVEHALKLLRGEGRLVTVMGKGLYVAPREQWRQAQSGS
jgi:GntR family transcriptional regulator